MIPDQADPSSADGWSPRRRGGPVDSLLDLFSSVWLGIFLLVLLFVYCSIGSAAPRVRQHPWLEMTEFEWFHWWPFTGLIGLICLTLVVVTVRRIPLRLMNAGVWMIHTGIIILCAGSVYYFSTKVEGDVPVFRRFVRIDVPGTASPTGLLVLPGARTGVTGADGRWEFRIQNTNTDYTLLTGADQGKKTYAVGIVVTPPAGEPFVRQLLAGYPQYTEDVIPGKGRAIKELGRKLVDEGLSLSLEYEPAEYFHVQDTWALYTRGLGEGDWVERPIKGLPRYHDRIASRDQVFLDEPLPLRPLDLEVPAVNVADPLTGAQVHVTGYLRYAQERQRWQDGGTQLNPRLRISLQSPGSAPQSFDLMAFGPTQRSIRGFAEFRYLDDPSLVDELPTDARATMRVLVSETDVSQEFEVTSQRVVGRDGPFTSIDGTEFSYRITNVIDDFVLNDGSVTSIAMVQIKDGNRTWLRMVSDKSEATRDMTGSDVDAHAAGGQRFVDPDPRIEITYRPAGAPLIFAALHDGRLFVVWNGENGESVRRWVRVGETIPLDPPFSVVPLELMLHARAAVKPYVVPRSKRQRNEGAFYTMIKLDVTMGGDTQSKWIPFSTYALPNPQYGYPGRLPYRPIEFDLPDGKRVEVLFSRQRRRLPAPIALEDFVLHSQIGGYSGSNLTVRNWESRLRFWDGDKWSDDVSRVSVNSPTGHGGFWYFQSAWDPPPCDDLSAGMNYTVLGVGNRNGVYIQLLGCCVAVAGMIFAFYVKPILRRRRQEPNPSRDRKEAGSFPSRDRKGAGSNPSRDREGAGSEPSRDREGVVELSPVEESSDACKM